MKAVDRRPKTEAERSETALACEPNRSLPSAVCRLWFCRGFTLIELMAVMTIIAILAGLIIGIAGYAQRKGADSQTRAEMKTLEMNLERYKLDNGIYPPCVSTNAGCSTNIYNAVTNYMTFATKQLSGTAILDPYGNEYLYLSPGATNKVTFDLWSRGADGANGTVDDITNWKP